MKTKRTQKAVEYHIHVEQWMSDEVWDKYKAYRDEVESHGEGELCCDEKNWMGSGFDIYRSPNHKDAVRFIEKLMKLGVRKDVVSFYDLVPRTF